MDRNSVIGLVLVALVLFAYSIYTASIQPPPEDQKPATEEVTDSVNTPVDSTLSNTEVLVENTDTLVADSTDTTAAPVVKQADLGPFKDVQNGEVAYDTLENDELKVVTKNLGGDIVSVELKNYKTFFGGPLVLFQEHNITRRLQFYINSLDVRSDQLFYTTSGITEQDGGVAISYKLKAADDKYIEQYFFLPESGFDMQYELRVIGMNEVIPQNTTFFTLTWDSEIKQLEQSRSMEVQKTGIYYSIDDEDANLVDDGDDEDIIGDVKWISYKQQFFNSTLYYEGGLESVSLHSEQSQEEHLIKTFEGEYVLPYEHEASEIYEMQYFFRPNHYHSLKDKEIGLEGIVSLAPDFVLFRWFAYVNKWLIIPVFSLLSQFIASYGLIIFLLTLVIKMLLTPLTYKTYVSQAKMKLLKPELDALREKHGDDQQKFGAEQMKLYQQAGVNPLGGCLPMLLQMPILISMYYFFPSSIELRQEAFLWANDLSTYDSIATIPAIPLLKDFYGTHVSLFTLLMAITSIIYAKFNQSMTPTAPGQPNMMKYMPYIFPIILLGVFNKFPAALSYYYFLFNVINIVQQLIIKRFFIDEDKLHQQLQDNKKKKSKKKGGFWSRVEEMQREQQKKAETAGKAKSKKKK